MPELIVRRGNPAPPPMVCMYCGAPATATTEGREGEPHARAEPRPGRRDRFESGPDHVTEDAVVLDRVRQAYFDATGLKPAGVG